MCSYQISCKHNGISSSKNPNFPIYWKQDRNTLKDVDHLVNSAYIEWKLRVKPLCTFKSNENVQKGGFCIIVLMCVS